MIPTRSLGSMDFRILRLGFAVWNYGQVEVAVCEILNLSRAGSIDLEDQGDLAGRSVSPIIHAVTPGIPIINPVTESP